MTRIHRFILFYWTGAKPLTGTKHDCLVKALHRFGIRGALLDWGDILKTDFFGTGRLWCFSAILSSLRHCSGLPTLALFVHNCHDGGIEGR